MCRKRGSCADFKAILTPFSRLRVVGFVLEILNAQSSKYIMQTVSRNSDPENSGLGLRPLNFFQKDLHCKFVSTLSPEMFYCHTRSHNVHRKNRDVYLLQFIAFAFGGYKTDFILNNIIATSVKKFTSKCHQSIGCYFKSCSVIVFYSV